MTENSETNHDGYSEDSGASSDLSGVSEIEHADSESVWEPKSNGYIAKDDKPGISEDVDSTKKSVLSFSVEEEQK